MSAAHPMVVRADRIFDGTSVLTATHLRVDRGLIDSLGGPEIIEMGDTVVDGDGATLLPGLIDAHVHLAPDCTVVAAQFGATTLVDQFSKPDLVNAERAAVIAASGGTGAARADFVTSSIGATAPGGHPTMAYSPFPYVTGPGDADTFVAQRVAEGATHLKIFYDDGSGVMLDIPALQESTIRALVDSAHVAGLPVVAHVSTGQGAALVARCGVDMLAHVPFTPMTPAQLDEVAGRGLAVIATLSLADGFPAHAGVMPLREDGLLNGQLTPAWRAMLDAQAARWMPPTGPDLIAAAANVRELHRRGCAILAGTDTPNPGLVYGASLHRELHHLATTTGLGPLIALRAATSVPARLFALHDRGVLRSGTRADLVLVDGNPLETITDTGRVRRTWIKGRPVDRTAYAGGATESATLTWLADSQSKILAAITEAWPQFAEKAAMGQAPPATGDPQVDAALTGLYDPDRDTRQTAALTLGTVADPAAARPLVARLFSEQDFYVRDTLSWALTRIAAAATPLLVDAVTDTHAATRGHALHALSKIADPATADVIVPLTTDPDPDVAAKARWALTCIGDHRTLAVAAARLGTGDSLTRTGLTRDLASFGRDAVPTLITALTDPAVAVRRHAADVLCYIGTGAEEATDALAAALHDPDEEVRLACAMALHDLGTPTAHAHLVLHTQSRDRTLRAIAHRAQSRPPRPPTLPTTPPRP